MHYFFAGFFHQPVPLHLSCPPEPARLYIYLKDLRHVGRGLVFHIIISFGILFQARLSVPIRATAWRQMQKKKKT